MAISIFVFSYLFYFNSTRNEDVTFGFIVGDEWNLVSEWKVASRETEEIELFLNMKALSNVVSWNFRKKETFPPAEFSMCAPIATNLKLFWNEDYCLDISKPGGEIISIWFSTRDYT
jgi:hypothetical protein